MIIGGLIVIALFAALIAPWFIDWTAYRTAFEREATRVVGQPVRVGGTARVRILPMPSVTFTDLTVGQNADGSPMMTVEAFSFDAELMPLLSGDVRIVDMTLTRPAVTVVVGDGGTVSWTARKQLLVDPEKVQVEQLNVVDGSFQIQGIAGGRTIRGEKIWASVHAQSLVGPWRISAEGDVDGVRSAFDISTGRAQPDGSLRIKTVARRAGQPYRLSLDGPVSLDEGVLIWNGQFEVAPAAQPAIAGEGELPEPLPVVATGHFAATPAAVEVPDYRLEVGPREDPYTVTGEGSARIREEISFKARAEGRQIDLDRLDQAAKQAPVSGATGLDRRLAVVRSIVDRIPVPQIEGEIDVMLPAVVAGDTMIREVKATVRPDRDGWRVDNLTVALPGNTLVEARGRLGTGGDFGFTGHMLLASRQPTGFAAWLTGSSSAALRRLSSAGFSADVTLSRQQASFDNLELVLDDAVLHGKVQRLAPADGRPGIVAELSGERINTDDLQAVYALTQDGEGTTLSDHDLDITLKAGLLEGFGLSARKVDAHVRVEGGSMSVDRLNAGDFYGAAVASSGRLANLLDKPEGRFTLTVGADDGSALAGLALRRLGENRFLAAFAGDPELSRGLSAKIEVEARPQGDASKGTVTASGWAGGTAFAMRDRFEGVPARWREAAHDISVKLKQDDPDILARQFAIATAPIVPDGPVTVTADLTGNPKKGLHVDFAASAHETDLSASGRLVFPDVPVDEQSLAMVPDFSLDVTFGTRDVDPWLIMIGYPLPGTGEGHPASLSFSSTGEKGVYRLAGIEGTHGDNRFDGELAIDTARAGRPKASGRMRFDTVSAPFVAEALLGAGTIVGDGVTAGIADTEFGLPLVAGLDAEIGLAATHLDLGGGRLGDDFAGTASLLDGTLTLQPFSAQWLGGRLSGNVSLKNATGNAILNAQLSLEGADAAKFAALAGFAPVVSGKADIGATLDAGGRSFKGLVAGLSGSGVVALNDGRIEGITTAGLEDILAAADVKDFEIKPETVRPAARKAMLTGSMAVPEASGAFALVQGRLSLRNVQVSDAGGTLDAQGSHDLVSGATEIGATLKLDPGKAELAGAEPAASFTWTGQPGDLALAVDTRALEGYLSLRAFEREQRRVEILQEAVLEKQRLRRETVLTNSRIAFRERQRQEELQRLQELQRELEEETRQPDEAAPVQAEPASSEPASSKQRAPASEAPAPLAPAQPAQTAPAPEPAANTTAAAPAPPAKEIEVIPLPSPAPRQAKPKGNFSLFDEIQRKLFGN